MAGLGGVEVGVELDRGLQHYTKPPINATKSKQTWAVAWFTQFLPQALTMSPSVLGLRAGTLMFDRTIMVRLLPSVLKFFLASWVLLCHECHLV